MQPYTDFNFPPPVYIALAVLVAMINFIYREPPISSWVLRLFDVSAILTTLGCLVFSGVKCSNLALTMVVKGSFTLSIAFFLILANRRNVAVPPTTDFYPVRTDEHQVPPVL